MITLLGQIAGAREFWSRFDSLYWSFITATTVGYGDIPPLCKLSKTFAIFITFVGLIFTGSQVAKAEIEWASFTMDNDIFVGNDNGYTNRLYVSWIDGREGEKPEPGLLARAMMWSLPDNGSSAIGWDIKTIGQTMVTPEDIEKDPRTAQSISLECKTGRSGQMRIA